jgi:hypothetical protein
MEATKSPGNENRIPELGPICSSALALKNGVESATPCGYSSEIGISASPVYQLDRAMSSAHAVLSKPVEDRATRVSLCSPTKPLETTYSSAAIGGGITLRNEVPGVAAFLVGACTSDSWSRLHAGLRRDMLFEIKPINSDARLCSC